MHAAFLYFTRHFHEPLLDEHTSRYVSIADKLCEEMPSSFDSENDRRASFKKFFGSLDVGHIELFLSAKVSTAEESVARFNVAKTIVDCEGDHLVLLLEEFKLESTEDVYMQICRSYEVLCGEEKNERLLKFGYPVFLLCVLGRYRNVDPE
jgi:hypothetical protein